MASEQKEKTRRTLQCLPLMIYLKKKHIQPETIQVKNECRALSASLESEKRPEVLRSSLNPKVVMQARLFGNL